MPQNEDLRLSSTMQLRVLDFLKNSELEFASTCLIRPTGP
jgi:hypothetical protein